MAESRGYAQFADSFGWHEDFSAGAVVAPPQRKCPNGRLEHWWGVADAGGVAWGVGSFPRRIVGLLGDQGRLCESQDLKTWIVGILLVAVLNVVGTAGAIMAAVLTG